MEKKILFPQIDGIMHGGDYNPEHEAITILAEAKS